MGHVGGADSPGGRSARRRAGLDLAWLVVGCVGVAAVVGQTRAITRSWDVTAASERFELDGILALAVLVPLAAIIFALRRHREAIEVRRELAELSLRDALTGLGNRVYLHRALAHDITGAPATGGTPAVLCIDLDHFKAVNDTYGRDTGDELMVAVADRLQSFVRHEDRLVRYGGDEFVIIRPRTPSPAAADSLATALITELERPFTLGTDHVGVSANIGVTIVQSPDSTPEDIIHEAAIATDAARSTGPGTWQRFDPRRHGNVPAPLSAVDRLTRALADGEFRLVYQPVVDLGTGQVREVEALLRWDDPLRGAVSPAEFIPALEETGLIVPVGAWVLTESCAQAQRWREELGRAAPGRMAVNVSARQLSQVGFRDRVTDALSRSGLPRDRLCLEITESALMADITAAWAALREVRSLGVGLALDNFGTGHASLTFVHRVLLDVLKIDTTFVDDLPASLEDEAIVTHVISLAHTLGLMVTAEGVEAPEQLAALRRLGCDLAQGYLLSPPVGPDEIIELCRDPIGFPATVISRSRPEGARFDEPPTSAPVVSPSIAPERPRPTGAEPSLPRVSEIGAELGRDQPV